MSVKKLKYARVSRRREIREQATRIAVYKHVQSDMVYVSEINENTGE